MHRMATSLFAKVSTLAGRDQHETGFVLQVTSLWPDLYDEYRVWAFQRLDVSSPPSDGPQPQQLAPPRLPRQTSSYHQESFFLNSNRAKEETEETSSSQGQPGSTSSCPSSSPTESQRKQSTKSTQRWRSPISLIIIMLFFLPLGFLPTFSRALFNYYCKSVRCLGTPADFDGRQPFLWMPTGIISAAAPMKFPHHGRPANWPRVWSLLQQLESV